MREERREQPLDGARLRRQARDTGDVEVRGLGAEQELRVEVDGGVHPAGMVEPDRDPGVGAAGDVRIHAQRDGDIGVVGEEDAPHGHGLKRLFGDLPQHGRGVEAYLGAVGRRERRAVGLAIVPHHVDERRRDVGVAEALDHHPVHARDLPVHGMRPLDADDRADPDRRAERRPEVKLVRRIGIALGGDDAA